MLQVLVEGWLRVDGSYGPACARMAGINFSSYQEPASISKGAASGQAEGAATRTHSVRDIASAGRIRHTSWSFFRCRAGSRGGQREFRSSMTGLRLKDRGSWRLFGI